MRGRLSEADEDALLEEMDAAWDVLSQAEQDELRARERSSFLRRRGTWASPAVVTTDGRTETILLDDVF